MAKQKYYENYPPPPPPAKNTVSFIHTHTIYLDLIQLFPSAKLLSTHGAGEAVDVVDFVNCSSHQILRTEANITGCTPCAMPPMGRINVCTLKTSVTTSWTTYSIRQKKGYVNFVTFTTHFTSFF